MSAVPANPLLQPWDTPYGLPPFDAVDAAHFAPAFDAAMREQRAEIEAIAANPQPPTFDNTLVPLDRSGASLARLTALFHNLVASASTPALQAVERELAAPLAAHEVWIFQHAALFDRVRALHEHRPSSPLDAEQRRLLERTFSDFVRAGARLRGAERARYSALVGRLAELTTRFAQNVLVDENEWTLALRDEADRAGLPAFARDAAHQAGVERELDHPVVTLSRSVVVPFLCYSTRRDLREAAWRAWVERGAHAGATDNRPLVREILALRSEQAHLLGYACYADYALADTMAGRRDAVQGLLDKVWAPALAAVARERDAVVAAMHAAGVTHDLQPWDWRFYAEQARRRRFDIDEAAVKPYFTLDRMVQALFDCAERLFGIQFVLQPQVASYQADVKTYEVRDAADGSLRGVFLHDNFARPGKRSGAWMSYLRQQHRNGVRSLPIVLNNNNFAKGGPGEPTLLSFDDARTLFHEFGHGLHGLLSDVTFRRLSGTNVLRDFVELPSQLFEHWLEEPAVLARHARHAVSGEVIAPELVERLQASRRFGLAYDTVQYAGSVLIDMAIHSLADGAVADVDAFEREAIARCGVPPEVGVRHRYAHFQHLFAGDAYAAGYYVYLWAEVLDADAFDAFVEAGDAFDAATARRLRECIYAAGDSREPTAAFRAFRGRDAVVEPMLRGRGLLSD